MLNELSPDQLNKMEEVKQYWLNYIFSCQNSLDRPKAKLGIDWLYNITGIDSPIVIFVDSPLACQYAVLYAKEYAKILQKGWSQVRSQVGSQVESQVWSQVRSQAESQVRSQVGSQVRSQVRSQVWSQVRSQGISAEYFCSYGSIGDYGWVSFYDFFTQIGIISDNNFNEFKRILESGVYDMIQLNGFCIVSDMPNKIERNSANLLHSTFGLAIEFKDGYGQHYINGRFLPEQYFTSISDKTFTMKDFIDEKNEEHKSTCIAFMQEKWGDEYIVTFFREHLKEVDTYVDKKDKKYLKGTTGGMNVGVYTLFKGEINGENIAYIRCFCPSTDRLFFLGVDDKHTTAEDSIASLYRLPSRLKPHIESISRQGERYSTILTDKGQDILKTLSKEEIADVSGLDGKTYFSLISYEY